MLLPGTRIGSNCIVGAGSVVRGTIPDNAVALGNPAAVVGRTGLVLEMMHVSPDTLDTFSLAEDDRERLVRAHFGRSWHFLTAACRTTPERITWNPTDERRRTSTRPSVG